MVGRGFIKPEDQEPEISGLEFYIDAFRELDTSRPAGLGLQAIPFTAVAEYFKIYELEDFDEFVYIIRLLDNTFLHLSEAAEKSERGGNATGKANQAHKHKN